MSQRSTNYGRHEPTKSSGELMSVLSQKRFPVCLIAVALLTACGHSETEKQDTVAPAMAPAPAPRPGTMDTSAHKMDSAMMADSAKKADSAAKAARDPVGRPGRPKGG